MGITVLKSIIRMPPKKGFSGQARNMCKDLFELLPVSTIETMQVKRLRIIDRLYDENNWVQDVQTTQINLNMVKKWFAGRNLYSHMLVYGMSTWES